MLVSNQTYLKWHQKLTDNKFFRWFWVFCGIYFVLLLFIFCGYLAIIKEYKVIIAALSALIFARYILKPLIYLFYREARPYQVLNIQPITSILFSEKTEKHNSFPSDHASSLGAVSTVLFIYFPFLGIICWLITLINGPARIILGYHYPRDVIAGWVLGVFVGLFMIYLFRSFGFT